MMLGISDSYRKLAAEEVPALAFELDSAWQDPAIPRRQWISVVRGELERLRYGQSLKHFDVLVRILKQTGLVNPTLLETGASSGFYFEILRLLDFPCVYSGSDYSIEYKRLATELFPRIDFHVADTRALPFADSSFDICLSGCCIIHIADYERAIAETARVASKFAVFNRTPILEKSSTEFFEKNAYGVRCLEIHFGQDELLGLFNKYGLKLEGFEDSSVDAESRVHYRTYLLSKNDAS